MKTRTLLQYSIAKIRSRLHDWTDSDCKMCRTCGMAFLLFAAILALPLLVSLVLYCGGFGQGPVGNLASYLLSSFGLALGASVTSAIAGIALLSEAKRMRERKLPEPKSLQRCGYLMLGLSLLALFPLLSSVVNLIAGQLFSFRMPFAVFDLFHSFTTLFYQICFLGLPLVRRHEVLSWLIFGTYLFTLNVFGLAILWLAIDLLKRSEHTSPSDDERKRTLVDRLLNKTHIAKERIYSWIDTDTKAYRSCGVVCFLFAAILILPIVWFQASTVLFQGEMTTVVDIWKTGGSQSKSSVVIPTLLILAIAIGAAIFSFVVGARLVAKARRSRGGEDSNSPAPLQCKRLLQRFAWLLLVIFPVVTAFNFRWGASYTIAGQLNMSQLFSTVDSSSWREARVTFLWMQFYPLLLLGIVALVLAVCMRPQFRKAEGTSSLEEKK